MCAAVGMSFVHTAWKKAPFWGFRYVGGSFKMKMMVDGVEMIHWVSREKAWISGMQSLHSFRVDILQQNVIRFVCFLPGNGLFGENKAACCPMCWRCRHRWRPLEWPGLQCRPTEWMFADWLIRSLKRGFCGSFNCMGPNGKLKTHHWCLEVFPLFHDYDCPKNHLKKHKEIDVEVPWPTQRHWLRSK